MSQSQRTLSGERLRRSDDDHPFGASYRGPSGDRRFSLHRCPGCGIRVNPHRWPGWYDVPAFHDHLYDDHDTLADFPRGTPDVYDEEAGRVGEVLR